MDRQLTKLGSKSSPNRVHRFRTGARRIETLLSELIAERGRNDKKLLKLLARLLKKTGRVRDLDVQISLLRALKMPEGARHKAQLLQALSEERTRREDKLAACFDASTLRELRKRLQHAAEKLNPEEMNIPTHVQRTLQELERQPDPLTDAVLHQYRLLGKRARYLAEIIGPAAASQIKILKRMHDALGEWHDWLKLTQRAENLFSRVPGSPLVAALRNLTRAKFRNAAATLAETRIALAALKPFAPEAGIHKLSASEPAIKTTAA